MRISRKLQPLATQRNPLRHGNWALQRRRLNSPGPNPTKIENINKEICKVFAKNNLRITIEPNKKVVNFLDVTLDLTTEKS